MGKGIWFCFYLETRPANVVALRDHNAIHKLLVEKGSIYPNRPMSYAAKIPTKGDHVAFEQTSPAWRGKCKVIAHNFSPAQLDREHFKIQEAE